MSKHRDIRRDSRAGTGNGKRTRNNPVGTQGRWNPLRGKHAEDQPHRPGKTREENRRGRQVG